MAEELRELRLSKQIPAKDMVAVVQAIYPKYDKTVQSKCENGDAYGVSLRPDAMAALYASECYYATQRLAVGVVRWSNWGSWLSTPFRRLHIPSCILPSWRRWRRIRAHCRNTARRWIK